MTKQKLKQYRALLKEKEQNDKVIDRLYDRAAEIPAVMGKVVGSSHDFPYTEVRTSVLMDDPVEADEINRRLKKRKERQELIKATVLEIEKFIAEIPDSETRLIFELTYLDGERQQDIADIVCMDRSRVSRRITDYLKNAQKAQK